MGRRIDVELTSARDDGTWTWRAAGARQPKGVVAAALLYEGAAVGDVVRAEADFEIEGILITAVHAPKEKKRSDSARLEIIGPPRSEQGVTTSLTGGERQRERGPRPGGDRRDRGPGAGPRPDGRGRPPRRDAPAGSSAGPTARGRTDRPDRPARPDRPTGERTPRADRPQRSAGPARAPGGDRPSRPAHEARPARSGADPASRPPKPKRLAPANVFRAAVLASLAPEEQPIAEQVLRGGIPAVRQAVEAQNARLREEGQPEVRPGPLVAMAEQLLPRLRSAEWRDRAEAAAKAVDEIALRDLRSVVAGADLARDDESRLLAGTLRQALDRRIEEHRQRWLAEITGALDEGRLVRALRASARPPDAIARFPAAVAARLVEAAGQALAADTPPDRWAALLDAVVESSVRRNVKPAGLPAGAGEDVLQKARQAVGRVPGLAPLLGIAMPPPPGPPRRPRPPGAGPAIPPPPPRDAAPTGPADTEAPAPVATPDPEPTAAGAPEDATTQAPEVEVPPEAGRPAAEVH